MKDRKLARVNIAPAQFAGLLHTGELKAIRVQGVPPSAELKRWGQDATRDLFFFVYADESFAEVPEFEPIPELNIVVSWTHEPN